MKKYLLLLICVTLFGQENTRWEDYYSYKNVSDIIDVNGILYGISENGMFLFDPLTGEVEKNSKTNDLNAVGLSAITFDSNNNFLMVGYENGELDLLGGEENINVLDIPLDDFQGSKRINHLFPFLNTLVISGEFGVVTYSIENLEFDETAFFTDNSGANIVVNESVVLDGIIYAASENGIYTHELNDFIPNFPAWEQPASVPTSEFLNLEIFNNELFAATSNQIYRFDGVNWSLFQSISNIRDLKSNDNVLSITRPNEIRQYNNAGMLINTNSFTETLNSGIQSNNIVYGATNSFGIKNQSNGNVYFPDGPFNNNAYGVTAFNGQIFIAPGSINNFNTPRGFTDGYFHFNTEQWIHNTSAELNNARDIIQITINPTDSTEIWASTWSNDDGILKVKSGVLEMEYDTDNSAITPLARIGGSVFDENGTLWLVQSFTHFSQPERHYLVSIDPNGNSQGINLLNGIANIGGGVNTPIVDSNGYIYFPGTRGGGVMITNGVDEFYSIIDELGQGDLPIPRVRNIALDLNNTLWIATQEGLRILPNPISAVQQEFFNTEAIVIEQNGLAEELFFETELTDVVVDGANRKWVSTRGAGVFYLSEDGEETIAHFTIANSPLPSNSVQDINIDPILGKVFFATDRGVVSYSSDITLATNSFGDVLAFPNPVRPNYTGDVTIKGLADDANVKITDVVGNLIFEGVANGGIIEWDTNNLQGQPVASGIYLVLMTNRDATESAYTKIAVVR